MVFEPGRTPALWENFRGLLKLVPQNKRTATLSIEIRQQYRWVSQLLRYVDTEEREHICLQLFEMGSLLKNIALRYRTDPLKLFGSLRNIARCLLECLRNKVIPDVVFDTNAAASIQIRLNTS